MRRQGGIDTRTHTPFTLLGSHLAWLGDLHELLAVDVREEEVVGAEVDLADVAREVGSVGLDAVRERSRHFAAPPEVGVPEVGGHQRSRGPHSATGVTVQR